jgi:hypothetical protein
MKVPPMLDDAYAQAVCKTGQGALTCRYLMLGGTGWRCGKLTDLRGFLDQKAANGEIGAQGDNCAGVDK